MTVTARRKRFGGMQRPAAWAREHAWLSLLLLAAVLFLAFEGAVHGPKVARQVWGEVGVRRVEEHAAIVRQAARESGVDPCLLAGIMYVESRGRVDAVSSADALGLFQLKVAAAGDSAKRLKLQAPTRDDLLSDPLLNTRLAASHVAWLYRHEGPDLERVLVAYNAGRGRLKEWLRDAGGWTDWREMRMRDGRSETLQYARDVIDFAARFRERGTIAGAAPGRTAEGVMAAPAAGPALSSPPSTAQTPPRGSQAAGE